MNNIENNDRTLLNLMQKVEDMSARSADYLCNTNNLQFETIETDSGNNKSRIVMESHKGIPTTALEVNDVAFDQIAAKADLPAKTARRLRDEYPDVLDHAVRRIWDNENEPRMVRALLDVNNDQYASGTARAFVSDRFKTFDNAHLLKATLPQLMESDAQWKVVRGDLTDKRMHLSFKSEVITADAAAREANPSSNIHIMRPTEYTRELNGVNRTVGDIMALGLSISNSEVGHGSIAVNQIVFTLACLNAMQTGNNHRSAHLTSSRGDAEFARILQADTVDADNRALELKLRDLIAAYTSEEMFDEVIQKFQRAHGELINAEPQKAVEQLGTILKLTKPETDNVLSGLMQTIQQDGYAGSPISRATMVNAVTAVQHKVSPDDSPEWQRLGGKVLDLPSSQWERVANAA